MEDKRFYLKDYSKRRKQVKKGKGITDYFNAFNNYVSSHQTFPGERHAVGIENNYNGKVHNFLGPGTQLDKRQNPPYSIPISTLDQAAKTHDYAYKNIGDAVKSNRLTKKDAMKKVWDADKQFINEARSDKQEPKLGNIAGNMINAKMNAEKIGVLPTKVFTGFGEEKVQIAKGLMDYEKNYLKKENKKNKKNLTNDNTMVKKNKKQQGGFIPLAPIAAAVAAPIVSELVSAAFKKLTGGKKKRKAKK